MNSFNLKPKQCETQEKEAKLKFNDSVEVYFYPAGQVWESDYSDTESENDRSESESCQEA